MPGASIYIKVTGRQPKLGEFLYKSPCQIPHLVWFVSESKLPCAYVLFIVFLKHRVLLIQVSRRPVAYAFERVVRLRT